MDTKQWVYLYGQFKQLLSKHAGSVPDDQVATEAFDLYGYIISHTGKSRESNPDINEAITNLFNYLFQVIHSLEVEQKPI